MLKSFTKDIKMYLEVTTTVFPAITNPTIYLQYLQGIG